MTIRIMTDQTPATLLDLDAIQSRADAEFIAAWRTDISALIGEVRMLRQLVDDLYDGEPCRYDHHGYCQDHGLTTRPCPHGRAAELLALMGVAS